MKWINEPVESTGYSEQMLALNQNEVKILLPVFERSLKEYQKRLEKLEDIHEGGEMTERQAARMCDLEEITIALEYFIDLAKPIR